MRLLKELRNPGWGFLNSNIAADEWPTHYEKELMLRAADEIKSLRDEIGGYVLMSKEERIASSEEAKMRTEMTEFKRKYIELCLATGFIITYDLYDNACVLSMDGEMVDLGEL